MNNIVYFLCIILSHISMSSAMNINTRFKSNEQELHCIQQELNQVGLGYDVEIKQLIPGLIYSVQRDGPGVYDEVHGPILGVVATYHDFVYIAEMLLEAGAFVDERSPLHKWTPLMRAARNHKNLDMIKLLLAHQADPLAKDSNGNTARDVAERYLELMKTSNDSKKRIVKQQAIINKLAQAESKKSAQLFTQLSFY